MYVTRPLSLYRRDPSALSLPPPEGPNSGVLIIQDVEAQPTCCCGVSEIYQVVDLPFPQNFHLTAEDDSPVVFIPVINQPLSSNRYYVIQDWGKHKGKALINSKEEDKTACCFCSHISDKNPEPFDWNNIYQQFEICKKDRINFTAKSIAADGHPPLILRLFWGFHTSSKHKFLLHEAPGLDKNLRAKFPGFNFQLSVTSSASVVVGKWYSPFIFIHEGSIKDQVKNSMYYLITLDQRWEKIFGCENTISAGNSLTVDVDVKSEVVTISGKEVAIDRRNVVDGVMWFRSICNVEGERSVGLSLAVVERMKWEQERVGWIGKTGAEKQVEVKRVEEFEGNGEWRKFGCYVLVERYLIKRADGNLVLSYEFKHTNQIRIKWE